MAASPAAPATPCAEALVCIDLQNDFFRAEPQFFLARRRRQLDIPDRAAFVAATAALCGAVRARGGLVVWLRARYVDPSREPVPPPQPLDPERVRRREHPQHTTEHTTEHSSGPRIAHNDAHLSHTHASGGLCLAGEEGAELWAPVQALVDADADVVMEKAFYSGFTDTALEAVLRERGVQRVGLCGVTTNNCVAATARDAYLLGFDVAVHANATASTSPKAHTLGLATLSEFCEIHGLGAGDSCLIPSLLPGPLADDLLARLLPSPGGAHADGAEGGGGAEVVWNALTNLKHGSQFPRLTAYQATRTPAGHLPAYRCADPQPWHGQYETGEWTPSVQLIKGRVEAVAGHTFNWSRILLYRSQRDGMGFHSDKALDLRAGSCIASLSLGQTRTYALRPKSGEEGRGPELHLPLRHNTCFLLGPETNRLFLHSILKGSGGGGGTDAMAARVSVTFRDLATFFVPGHRTPRFYGQGTAHATLEELEAEPQAASEAEEDAAWTRAQLHLGAVYRELNRQALTSEEARHLVLTASDRELGVGAAPGTCARDS